MGRGLKVAHHSDGSLIWLVVPKPPTHGINSQLDAVLKTQLLHNISQMEFNGVFRDMLHVRHLLVRAALNTGATYIGVRVFVKHQK